MLHPLKKYLQEADTYARDFAKELQVSEQAISNIISGRTFPSFKTLVKIIEHTEHKITADILLDAYNQIKKEKEDK